jgi:CRISPR-associated protein Cmr2
MPETTINSGKISWQWLSEWQLKDTVIFSISLSPAQEFINEARKGRDLRAGSLLLSYLSFKLFEPILANYREKAFIVPDIRENPFFTEWEKNSGTLNLEHLKALGAGGKSITNRAIGVIEKGNIGLLVDAERSCHKAWDEYASFCKNNLQAIAGPGKWEEVWDQQLTDFSASFDVYWTAVETNLDQLEADIQKVIARMERRKDTRLFTQWQGSSLPKCIQCGHREILTGTDDKFWAKLNESFCKDIIRLEDNREILCSACLAKRLFGFSRAIFPEKSMKSTIEIAAAPFLATFQEKTYLLQNKGDDNVEKMALDLWQLEIEELFKKEQELTITPFEEHLRDIASLVLPFEMKSTIKRQIRKITREYLYKKTDGGLGLEEPAPYLAVVMFDGDKMGKTLSQHPEISSILTSFSRGIPALISDPAVQGETIYSSGDEMLALLPINSALSVLRRIHAKFADEISATTCSAGITFFHCKESLQLALKDCRDALHHAKETYGRNSVVFSVLIASGTSYRFGIPWKFSDVDGTDFDVLAMMEELIALVKAPEGLSRRFLYDLMMELPACVPAAPFVFLNDHPSSPKGLPVAKSADPELLKPRLLRLWERHIHKNSGVNAAFQCHFIASMARYAPKVQNRVLNLIGYLKVIDFLSR